MIAATSKVVRTLQTAAPKFVRGSVNTRVSVITEYVRSNQTSSRLSRMTCLTGEADGPYLAPAETA